MKGKEHEPLISDSYISRSLPDEDCRHNSSRTSNSTGELLNSRLVLYPLNHNCSRIVFDLSKDVLIGRRRDLNLNLLEERLFMNDTISRNHALIRQEGGKVFISDLDSSNGTFVNGRSLDKFAGQEMELETGSILQLGRDITIEQPSAKYPLGGSWSMKCPIIYSLKFLVAIIHDNESLTSELSDPKSPQKKINQDLKKVESTWILHHLPDSPQLAFFEEKYNIIIKEFRALVTQNMELEKLALKNSFEARFSDIEIETRASSQARAIKKIQMIKERKSIAVQSLEPPKLQHKASQTKPTQSITLKSIFKQMLSHVMVFIIYSSCVSLYKLHKY